MTFDFDKVIERRGTNCIKYDFAKERGKAEDVLPLWVADMDFQTAPSILESLEKTVKHGIFGYSEGKEAYFLAVYGWYKTHFDWEVQREWMVKTPGIVFAISNIIRALTKEGESVLIQQPVYYPFGKAITSNQRKLVNNPLKLVDGHYEIDFEDFENKIIENEVKMFVLCSPHNPVGRVWKEWELKKMGDICLRHGVLVVSDEIHSDFVWQGHRHRMFASLSEEYAQISLTCTSPSKTFNIAGLQISNIFVPNKKLRDALRLELVRVGYDEMNIMGLVACQAAYEGGEEWLAALKNYIWDNYLFLKKYCESRMPKLRAMELEGTYLAWVDFREMGMTEEQREDLIVNKARLWLDSGAMFGAEGEGFERFNLACPRKTLEQALTQLENAMQ